MENSVPEGQYFWLEHPEEAAVYAPCESKLPLDHCVHLRMQIGQAEYELVGQFTYSTDEGLVFVSEVSARRESSGEWIPLQDSINATPFALASDISISLTGDWGRWVADLDQVKLVSPVTFGASGRFQQKFRFPNNALFWFNRGFSSELEPPSKWVSFGLHGFEFPSFYASYDDDSLEPNASKYGPQGFHRVQRLRLEGNGWKLTVNPVHEHSRDSFSCLTHRGNLAYKEDLVGLEGGSPDLHTIDALETFLQFFSGRFCSVAHVGHAQWELFRRVSTLVDFNPVRTWGSESFADMRIASKVFEGVLSVFRTRPKEQVDALRELVSVRGVGRTTYQDYLVADAIKSLEMLGLWLENEERVSQGRDPRKEFTLSAQNAKKYFARFLPSSFQTDGEWEDWADVVGKDAISFRNYTQHAGALKGREEPWPDLTLVWANEIFDLVLEEILLREAGANFTFLPRVSARSMRCPNCNRPEYRGSIRIMGKYCHKCVPKEVTDDLNSMRHIERRP